MKLLSDRISSSPCSINLDATKKSNLPFLVALCCVATTLITACASATKEQQETAMGSGMGELAGVLLGDSRQSAAMGVALGALGGYAGSKNMEVKKQASGKATA